MSYTKGTTASSYTPAVNAEMQMIGKIAESVLRQVEANNVLSVFKKQPVGNGDTIEKVIMRIIEAQPYNKEGKNALHRWADQHAVARYYNEWTPKKFPATVDKKELRKIANGQISAEEMADNIISTLTQSDEYDEYNELKGLLKWGVTNSNLKHLTDVDVTAGGTTDYKGILKAIKNTVKGMQYVNNSYNAIGTMTITHDKEASGTGVITKTTESVPFLQRSRAEDIFIVMPYTLVTDIDVDELAGVFNMDKAEIKSRIIEIDSTDKYVYIVDRNAILDYTRLYDLVNAFNEDGYFWNYVLHVERLYGLSQLFNACYFEYDTTPSKQ